jgi:ATP-dependent DNA helicase RecG
MRSIEDIEKLLPELENHVGDELEDQDLDFKEWDMKSMNNSVKTVVRMAVCMTNGGGGTVVFGVTDKDKGRANAIKGVPVEVDTNLLKMAVYDQTDPKITPFFEEMAVPEGTGRLILMHVHPGLPPHTDSAGRGWVRVGTDCQPLTGSLRRKITIETGESDYSAEAVASIDEALISATAMEALRNQALEDRAPEDMMLLSDIELLAALGLTKGNNLTRAAIYLVGTEVAIREYVPGYNWTFLSMSSDIDYDQREDSVSGLVASVVRIEELIRPFNSITTYKQGLFHYEYRTWPEVAIREALMNAFSHVELRIGGPILVKLYSDKIEISNNGGFIAGITEDNILHHQPAARNPLLVNALAKLRLVNRSNLGVGRIFSSLLAEGKEPPVIHEIGESVTVTFFKRDLNTAFRSFVTDESERGRHLGVDELIILLHLVQYSEIDTQTAAHLCQRTTIEVREHLSNMEKDGYIEHGGSGKGSYWSMNPVLYNKLSEDGGAEKRRRIDWEAAKTRVLSIMMERAGKGDEGLSNQDIRSITRLDRDQVRRLMKELRDENPSVQTPGRGRNARYEYCNLE